MGGNRLIVVGVSGIQIGLQRVDTLEQLVGLGLELGGRHREGTVGRNGEHAEKRQGRSEREGARPPGKRSAACAWCVFGLHRHLLFL